MRTLCVASFALSLVPSLTACGPLPKIGSSDKPLALVDRLPDDQYCGRATLFGQAPGPDDGFRRFVVGTEGDRIEMPVRLDVGASVERSLVAFSDVSVVVVLGREERAPGDFSVSFGSETLRPGLYQFRTTAFSPGYTGAGLSMQVLLMPIIDPTAPLVDKDGDCVAPRAGDCNDEDAGVSRLELDTCGDKIDNDCDGIVDNCMR